MFLLVPFSIAWALWALEGLYLLALMGFSVEQLRVSTHLLVLTALPLQVTVILSYLGSGHSMGCPRTQGW